MPLGWPVLPEVKIEFGRAERVQMMGKGIGRFVKFTIGKIAIPGANGWTIRNLLDLLLEQGVYTFRMKFLHTNGVPSVHLATGLGADEVDVDYRLVDLFSDAG
ncbi:hypothetical protein HG530_011604 [Fusarium avenaceum]|nr:hypothetical protein HG530_011604 [Fusarium avenaceum]